MWALREKKEKRAQARRDKAWQGMEHGEAGKRGPRGGKYMPRGVRVRSRSLFELLSMPLETIGRWDRVKR